MQHNANSERLSERLSTQSIRVLIYIYTAQSGLKTGTCQLLSEQLTHLTLTSSGTYYFWRFQIKEYIYSVNKRKTDDLLF